MMTHRFASITLAWLIVSFLALPSFTTNYGTMVNALSSASSKPTKVALVGSTGTLGRRALDHLLARNIPVKCWIRQQSPPDFLQEKQKEFPDLLEFETNCGNDGLTDPAKVTLFLTDCSHCLALHGATRKTRWYELLSAAEESEDEDPTHAKNVNYRSMECFVQAAKSTGCQQIVRITGKGESPSSFFSVLINGLGSMAKGWNYEGEQVLRQQTDMAYTIVRPGIMKTDYDPAAEQVHLELADNGGDLPVSAVSYEQIADLCVESLFQPQARRTTLTVMNVKNSEGGDSTLTIAQRLQKVQKDVRIFPKSLIAEHKSAVKRTFRSVAAVFAAIVVGVMAKLFS